MRNLAVDIKLDLRGFDRVYPAHVPQPQGKRFMAYQILHALADQLNGEKHILSNVRMNDEDDIDGMLRSINGQLEVGQYFIGCANYLGGYDTKVFRRGKAPSKVWMRRLAFLFHRVFPKLKWGARLYRILMKGRSKRMSKTEILGRLVYAGFSISKTICKDVMMYYVVTKKSKPLDGFTPSFGPLIQLNRIGENGKQLKIYKMRTMHPYAEFIQEYVYEQNDLAIGGKIKDDFRVSEEGVLFRKLFLDELPMLINLFKGDIKLVGVRPLSKHYFSLYTAEMQRRRIKMKPGLLPPFYGEKDKPKTLEEVMVSEMRYILQYEKAAWKTDLKYFFRIMKNILIRKQRST